MPPLVLVLLLASRFSVGDRVQVSVMQQKYPGVVTSVFRDTAYTIRYDNGYGEYATLAEYLHSTSGRPWRNGHGPEIGDAVNVRLGGTDYRAHVTASRKANVYRVRYSDGSEWDTLSDYMQPAAVTRHVEASVMPSSSGDAPVEYTFLGMDLKNSVVRYRIKVDTQRPIEEVDIATKFIGANGKVDATTIVWQNIVGSKRQPIVSGKSYEDTSYLSPGTVRVETRLLRVVYSDGTRWTAPQ
jgi:hypothetical protein